MYSYPQERYVISFSKSIRARAIKFPLTRERKRAPNSRQPAAASQSGKMAVCAGLCRVRFLIKNDFIRVFKYSTFVNSVSLNSVSKKKQAFIYQLL